MKVQGQRCNCRVIQIVSQNVPAEEDRGAETKFEIHGAENYFTHWTNKLFRKDPVLINTQSKQRFSHVSIYLKMQLVQLKNTYYVLKKINITEFIRIPMLISLIAALQPMVTSVCIKSCF